MVEGKPVSGGKQVYAKPDAVALLHKSLTWFWWILEVIPKRVKWRRWPRRRGVLGLYLPVAEPRFIPDGAIIHESAVRRREEVATYRPENWPTNFAVEHDVPQPADRPRRRPQTGGPGE